MQSNRTCEKCSERPVEVTEEIDGFSVAMIKTGHLVCAACKGADEARDELTAKAETFPCGPKRNYARKIVRLILSGKRSHGQDMVPSELSASVSASIRTAIDAEWDRVRCAGLAVGDRIVVRSYCDDAEREAVVVSFAFGASAPICTRVEYPEGFLEEGGYAPINPSNYSLDRIVAAHG